MTDDPSVDESAFSGRLVPRGRILEESGHFVWGCSPIHGPDGAVHVFYSRWRQKHGMKGFLIDSEVAHAVAGDPEGPYDPVGDGPVLAGAGGDAWDGVMIHNPTVHEVDGRYVMAYAGNSLTYDDTLVETTAIGLAFADSLAGPWTRHPGNPIVERGEAGEWDSVSVDNPAFFRHPDGRSFVYYRSWTGRDSGERNDRVGVAVADDVEGPYRKYEGNPVVDPTGLTDRRPVGVEDPCAFLEDGTIHLVVRDFGVLSGRSGYSPCGGLLFTSDDGVAFARTPEVAYHEAAHYYDLDDDEAELIRYGRFERPKVLLRDGRPTHLFNAIRGGEYGTASGHVFEIAERRADE